MFVVEKLFLIEMVYLPDGLTPYNNEWRIGKFFLFFLTFFLTKKYCVYINNEFR